MVDLCFETDEERCANASGAKLSDSSVSSACRYCFNPLPKFTRHTTPRTMLAMRRMKEATVKQPR